MLTIKEIEQQIEAGRVELGTKRIGVNAARPSNVKAHTKSLWETAEAKAMRESFKRKFGVDFADRNAFPVATPGFSWGSVAEKTTGSSLGYALREAESGSSFTQVLRAGVQSIVNQMYETVETTHESWAHVVNSSKDTELYAPLHGISFPTEVGKQERFPESYALGLDIKLRNKKYGQAFAVEKELLEDDQTGQFQKQAGLMGEYAKLVLEVLCYAKLQSVANMSYGGMAVPPSETQPSDESAYPWSTALVGGGKNRPASFGALNQANVQAGFIGLMNQKNKLGLKMLVSPNRLIISPHYRFDAAVLLHSAYYPSVPSATPGAVGANFAINPIEGIAALTVSRFVFDQNGSVSADSKAWYLVDDSKPWFVLQLRQGPEVVQENPASGESFDRDVIRFKMSLRANADHIDPRFAWLGSDGSV